jgi:hypothetical protein
LDLDFVYKSVSRHPGKLKYTESFEAWGMPSGIRRFEMRRSARFDLFVWFGRRWRRWRWSYHNLMPAVDDRRIGMRRRWRRRSDRSWIPAIEYRRVGMRLTSR